MHQGSTRTSLKGVRSEVNDGDSRYTSDINYVVAPATVVDDDTVATTLVLIEHARDDDEGIRMVGSEGAMAS